MEKKYYWFILKAISWKIKTWEQRNLILFHNAFLNITLLGLKKEKFYFSFFYDKNLFSFKCILFHVEKTHTTK